MKYITLVTRHHDGFSMWDTKYSNFNIMNTPFKRDIVKELADECHQQGIKIFFYYSLLDWRREDYCYTSGETGKATGRKIQTNWLDYIQFMKNQLSELLSNYGTVAGIWFDGMWDQIDEGKTNIKHNDSRVDWHLKEIYDLIHNLQPNCLVGNNHHMEVLDGEDFQMFEQGVPNEKSGFNLQQTSNSLPLETCATINNSWGYNITDTTYKPLQKVLRFLVKSAGSGGNLLLNIGPMPNGKIQPAFVQTLNETKQWLNKYGASIFATNAGYIKPPKWGAITQGENKMYIHFLDTVNIKTIVLQNFNAKISKAYLMNNAATIYCQQEGTVVKLNVPIIKPSHKDPDIIVVLETK